MIHHCINSARTLRHGVANNHDPEGGLTTAKTDIEDPGPETFVHGCKSAIIPSASGNATPAWIGGITGASFLTTWCSGTAVILGGMGSAGLLCELVYLEGDG